MKEWSASAIYNDIIELKKEGAELLGKADARMILKRIVDNRTKVVQRMWDVYDKAVKEGNLAVELKSLNDIDELKRKNISDLQELGFIAKPVNPTEVESEFAKKLDEYFKEGREDMLKRNEKRNKKDIPKP